jgi:hypothetical protein
MPDISDTLKSITQTYEQIKVALDSKIASKGYVVIKENYHPESFGNRYVIWSNTKDSIRLIWDGKDGWFYLQTLETLPSDWMDDWKDVIYIPYDPREHGQSYVHDMQVKILNGIN